MSRAALPLAGVVIVALMLAGAYAMEAYAPAGTPRVTATWGMGQDGRPADAVEILGVSSGVLRQLRARSPSEALWSSAFQVVVERPSGATPVPHVIGRYAALGDRIRFEPRFPFAPGVAYRVELDQGRLEAIAGVDVSGTNVARVTHRFSVAAAPAAPTTRILAVHPDVDRVPSNLLRWYIEFSSPMEPGSALDHVRLLDEAGRPVEDAFLRVAEELWDGERRRLTLFFDPGRVKRGVRQNVEMGAPLTAGHRYRLVVDAGWKDARGAALASGFDREFDVAPFDSMSPAPARWRLVPPKAGTRDPLRVSFGEPLDHALAARMLSVEQSGRRAPGVAELGRADSVWLFTPSRAWQPGAYTLRVDAALEDLAGNSVARVFDADRGGGAPGAEEAERAGKWRRVEFRIVP
jgi:hypothetical protein